MKDTGKVSNIKMKWKFLFCSFSKLSYGKNVFLLLEGIFQI